MKRAVIALLLALGVGAGYAGEQAPPPVTKAPPAAADAPKAAPEAGVVKCPVTGEEVSNPAEAPSSEYKGVKYFFCCPPCKVEFEKDPEKYQQGK